MNKFVFFEVFAILMVGLGCVLLLFPKRVQAVNIRLRGEWIKPIPRLMNSTQEIWTTRVSGAGLILLGLLVGVVLWVNR
jgi:hypothetical protein